MDISPTWYASSISWYCLRVPSGFSGCLSGWSSMALALKEDYKHLANNQDLPYWYNILPITSAPNISCYIVTDTVYNLKLVAPMSAPESFVIHVWPDPHPVIVECVHHHCQGSENTDIESVAGISIKVNWPKAKMTLKCNCQHIQMTDCCVGPFLSKSGH